MLNQATIIALILWGISPLIAGAQDPETSVVQHVEAESSVEPTDIDSASVPTRMLERTEINALLQEALEDAAEENYIEAIPKFERVIGERPSAMPAWESLGWAYWKTGHPEKAIRLWKDLRTLNPDLPQVYNLLGMAATAEDRLDDAIAYYKQSLELEPDQFATRLSLARIYRWQGRLDESVQLLTTLNEENPEALDVRLELGRAQLQNWEFERAEQHWIQIYAKDPTNMENRISLATVYLNNGKVDESVQIVRDILQEQPNHRDALMLLADSQEYGEKPEEAIPTLQRLIAATEEKGELQRVRTRLIRLHVRLHKQDPKRYTVEEAIRLTQEMIESEPMNADTRLLLGELYSMNLQFKEAEENLRYVLEHMNPQNQRAHRGLFEVYLGNRDYDKAKEELDIIEAFNPDDPYVYYRIARYEAGRARFYEAFKALDELERRGRNGAVAVLLYHAISPSDWTAPPSVRRLREQLFALKDAGFRFITPADIPAYFESLPEVEKSKDPKPLDLVVAVTFDDALRNSMLYGTQVAEELDTKFTQFVITGYTERKDPFISTWDELREWAKTGRWGFQSQLYLAEQRRPVDADHTIGLPLANRLWLEEEQRNETPEEYQARIQFEYPHSQHLLRENLPGDRVGVAIAYPLGEIGQETLSNEPDAIPTNLAVGSETYEIGFLQSPFGYAVKGDHRMLYQRNELHRSAEGAEALAQVMENHPVLLAERLRAEFAAMQGKVRLAKRSLKQLKEDGYPSNSMVRVETYVNDRMARRFAAPTAAESARKGLLGLELSAPYLGLGIRYFEDNLDRENVFVDFIAGFNLMPRLTLEGKGGFGQLKQITQERAVEGVIPPSRDLKIDETHASVRGSYVISDRTMISAEGGMRDFGSPADANETVYSIEAYFRPILSLDAYVLYTHDMVESAQSVIEGVTYDLISAHGIYHALDWLDLWVNGALYDFSDNNSRQHLTLAAQWLIIERIGFYMGLRYGYVDADKDRPDYWTPYKLHRYYIEALLRKNYLHIYYNLGVRVGVGRQSVRPEADAAYADLVERARVQRFDPGKAPEEDWETILGLFASTRIKLGGNWEATGAISYSRLPDYDELNIDAGLKYRF